MIFASLSHCREKRGEENPCLLSRNSNPEDLGAALHNVGSSRRERLCLCLHHGSCRRYMNPWAPRDLHQDVHPAHGPKHPNASGKHGTDQSQTPAPLRQHQQHQQQVCLLPFPILGVLPLFTLNSSSGFGTTYPGCR